MTIHTELRVTGLDLFADDVSETWPEELADLFIASDCGVQTATVFTDGSPEEAIRDTVVWAREIEKLMPGAEVAGVHDELVSVPDIARRVPFARESVRLWAEGQRRAGTPFPAPVSAVGTGSGTHMKLYAWRHVIEWLRDCVLPDFQPDEHYLSDGELARLGYLLTARADDAEG